MASNSILLSNVSLYPIEVHWCFNGKERIESLRDRAINHEIVFSSEEEKNHFMKVHNELFETKQLVVGKANDKQMQKAKEEKDKEESKKAKELQAKNDKEVKSKVAEITAGQVKDFEVQTEKGEGK